MRVINKTSTIKICMLALSLVCSSAAFAQKSAFDRLVVFGSSLSDSGNAFVLINNPSEFGLEDCPLGTPLNVPPYDQMDKLYLTDDLYVELLVPDGVYARGGHHVTNGATWIEQYALGQGLSGTVRPALRNPGLRASNYAVGGARARLVTDETPVDDVIRCRFNLSDQVSAYLTDYQIDAATNPISANTLFVIEIGGNDVRDALNAANPSAVLGAAIGNISQTMQTLYGFGARNFLLMNVPNIGITPTVRLLDGILTPPPTPLEFTVAYNANLLAVGFNTALGQVQEGLSALPGIHIRTLNLYGLLEEIVLDQENNASNLFGITNVTDACINPNKPPFTCKKPDTYLFWDGIHPTKAVHGWIAQRAIAVLQ
ncbi:SGNH/GDSL hydrolase family protein [Methylomonas sp. SURF-2]|uniref:SGNH/GDSL hydrolase family protein n=1 Tax=Methylomonas subterranea TaxID=2952225 RepID=A0ABT1TJD0_9GAMM|nr:SGNH/GDSL hydrolase family protein [Methylomonas sp. SURF-2]MCQ8105540.1 SGNH/GDSL hydrolase family protein [Methylomonas sp. SURF-2]